MEIQARVDPRKCMANQVCTAIAPALFELGAAGYSRLQRSNFTPADLALLREAEENCPTGAIRIEAVEDAGGSA